MKRCMYILYFCLPLSFFAQENSSLVTIKKSITKKDVKSFSNLLNSIDSSEVLINIKENREELLKLADSSYTVLQAKEKLGEKKYSQIKYIGIGTLLVGYSIVQTALSAVFSADELGSSEQQGFFSYSRLTDLGIGVGGGYYIYCGITGKNPQKKVSNALEIFQSLQEKLSEEVIA